MKHADCIIFPDIHGRDFWKRVLIANCNCEWETEKFIFLGDYFDPYRDEGISVSDALRNWYELMIAVTKWKENHKGDFIFLMGNHDAHYINSTFNAMSGGCRKSASYAIPYLLGSMNLRIAYEQNIGGKRVLFSHAGVMENWYHAHEGLIGKLSARGLNNLVYKDEGWRALAEYDFYRGGNYSYGSPLWADMQQRDEHENELKDLGYDYQVIGHTQIVDDKPIVLDAIADLDCREPFALTSNFNFVAI